MIRIAPTEILIGASSASDIANNCTADYIEIIKLDIVIDSATALCETVRHYSRNTLFYGDKLAVNSIAVLDGIADDYGYFFCSPQVLEKFTPGELTFGKDCWLQCLLMRAIAKGYEARKVEHTCAYRIRNPMKDLYAKQVISSSACISSVLAQFLPREFKEIPSLKLSFDIETPDFERFSRGFIARHAA